jgi:hypothetical protein
VRLIKDLRSGVNGIIGKKENLVSRAKIKNFEEVVIIENGIKLVKSTEKIKVSSAQYENYEWEIFPFLFETKQTEVKLNWENSEFK